MAYINKEVSTMAMPSGMNRMGQFPLDMSSVYYDLKSLQDYATSGAVAYVGQILSLVDETNNNVTLYAIKNTAGDLVEIAADITIPEVPAYSGDKAIKVEDYKISVLVDDKTIKIGEDNKLYAVIPEDKDTKTEVVSGDDLIIVTPDELVENSLNTYTIKIDDAKLKALIGSETTAAMEFKGAVAELPVSANKGDVYKASAAFIVDSTEDAEGKGYTTEIGDSIVADENGKWYLIPSGDDIEDTWRPVTGVDNTSTLTFEAGAKLDVEVKADGTITYSHEKVDAPILVAGGSGRTYITELVADEYGHITGYKVATESDQEIPEDTNTRYELSAKNDDTMDNTINLVLSNDENTTKNLVPVSGDGLIGISYDDDSKTIIVATPDLGDGLIVNDDNKIVLDLNDGLIINSQKKLALDLDSGLIISNNKKLALDLGDGLGIDDNKKVSILVPTNGHIVVNGNNELTLGVLPVYESSEDEDGKVIKTLVSPGTGIFKDVYTKEETNDAIADAVKVATGGESASDVLIELNNYKKKVNLEVWGDESGSGSTYKEQTNQSRIDILRADVGDLTQLIRDEGRENTTLVDEINYINERLTWGEMV